jgi:hypothetical protein
MFKYEVAQPTATMLLTEILDLETGLDVVLQSFLTRDLGLVMKDRGSWRVVMLVIPVILG